MPERYTVSILAPKAIGPDERITQVDIHVSAGAIQSVAGLPVGWHIVIDNDASWQTKIWANATVGAAFITSEELSGLRIVLVKNEFGGLKFAVSGEISVTKDSANEKLIRLTAQHLKVARER